MNGKELRAIRYISRLSLRHFADKLAVRPTTIIRYEYMPALPRRFVLRVERVFRLDDDAARLVWEIAVLADEIRKRTMLRDTG